MHGHGSPPPSTDLRVFITFLDSVSPQGYFTLGRLSGLLKGCHFIFNLPQFAVSKHTMYTASAVSCLNFKARYSNLNIIYSHPENQKPEKVRFPQRWEHSEFPSPLYLLCPSSFLEVSEVAPLTCSKAVCLKQLTQPYHLIVRITAEAVVTFVSAGKFFSH